MVDASKIRLVTYPAMENWVGVYVGDECYALVVREVSRAIGYQYEFNYPAAGGPVEEFIPGQFSLADGPYTRQIKVKDFNEIIPTAAALINAGILWAETELKRENLEIVDQKKKWEAYLRRPPQPD